MTPRKKKRGTPETGAHEVPPPPPQKPAETEEPSKEATKEAVAEFLLRTKAADFSDSSEFTRKVMENLKLGEYLAAVYGSNKARSSENEATLAQADAAFNESRAKILKLQMEAAEQFHRQEMERFREERASREERRAAIESAAQIIKTLGLLNAAPLVKALLGNDLELPSPEDSGDSSGAPEG